MKNGFIYLFLTTFLLASHSTKTFGQCPNYIILNNQAAVDNFSTNYPDCIPISNGLDIQGVLINNLNGLSQVTQVGGPLTISALNLSSLSGLSNLQSVSGHLSLRNAPITSLSGLGSLTTVGSIGIGSLPSLTSLTGLGSLSNVSGDFSLVNNDALTNLSGLPAAGFSVGGNLSISDNDAMTSLSGLSGTVTVNGNLTIVDNPVLSDISAFQNIDLSGINLLSIVVNPSLSVCEISNLCNYLSTPSNPADFAANASGCNTRAEVEAACLLLPIELLSFEGKESGQDYQLVWQTATEQENSHFEVEHSRNGISFKAIGRVEGTGTKTSGYEFLHRYPVPGTHYYRLKQYDLDGTFSYSPIITAKLGSNWSVRIYPNPVSDNGLRVAFDKPIEDDMVLFVHRTDGSTVLQQILSNNQTEWAIPTADLLPGVYTVELHDGQGFRHFQKVVKI